MLLGTQREGVKWQYKYTLQTKINGEGDSIYIIIWPASCTDLGSESGILENICTNIEQNFMRHVKYIVLNHEEDVKSELCRITTEAGSTRSWTQGIDSTWSGKLGVGSTGNWWNWIWDIQMALDHRTGGQDQNEQKFMRHVKYSAGAWRRCRKIH